MTTYYIADPHLGHTNIIKYCHRPFNNVEHMNRDLIANWNSVVTDDDSVYLLGDITLSGWQRFVYYMNQLNGNIRIIPGNQDRRWLKRWKNYPFDMPGHVEVLDSIVATKEVIMCHYPLLTWSRSHYGVINLHGHSHGVIGNVTRSGLEADGGYRVDVGVDCWNYYPVTMDQIKRRISDG